MSKAQSWLKTLHRGWWIYHHFLCYSRYENKLRFRATVWFWSPWSAAWKNECSCVLLFPSAVRQQQQHISVFTTQPPPLRYFQQVAEKENPVTMVEPVVSCFSYFASRTTNTLQVWTFLSPNKHTHTHTRTFNFFSWLHSKLPLILLNIITITSLD